MTESLTKSAKKNQTGRWRRAVPLLCGTLALLCAALPAGAAEPPHENLVNFSSTAQIEVERDLLSVTLQVVRDGSDAATVQSQLKQTLDGALAAARPSASPGAMEVRTGSFSLSPRYGKDGKINGWQGQAELVLEGTDVPRVAQTAGRLAGMNVVNVGYSISRALAQQHEAEVTAQAIAKYRAQAQTLAQAFGFRSYALRDVSVQTQEQGSAPRPMFRAKAEMAMAADAPLPVEPGKGTLSATVSGSVQLLP